jgi:hypothetical protein
VRFGEYLISCNLVSEDELIAALDEQSRCSPFSGAIAVELGYLSASQSFHLGEDLVEEGCEFLELARRRGLLDSIQVTMVLRLKADRTPKIGQIFVRRQVVAEASIAPLLKAFFVQERDRAGAPD